MPADDLAHRIRKGRDLAHGGGQSLDALVIQPQPVDQRFADAFLAPPGDVSLVRSDDARRLRLQRQRDGLEHTGLVAAGEGCGGA